MLATHWEQIIEKVHLTKPLQIVNLSISRKHISVWLPKSLAERTGVKNECRNKQKTQNCKDIKENRNSISRDGEIRTLVKHTSTFDGWKFSGFIRNACKKLSFQSYKHAHSQSKYICQKSESRIRQNEKGIIMNHNIELIIINLNNRSGTPTRSKISWTSIFNKMES